jgi:hypothetical protein
MIVAGALTLQTADVAFFAPPPRPPRPERRTKRGAGATVRTLFTAFRRELALAVEEAEPALPRLAHAYPYPH